ncbi:hypothetical protein EI94DRAFT_1708189 [Lactarius quietus]|nr:hypothetical protein EI94DRAFT_1708189 [Lactarius quietus]
MWGTESADGFLDSVVVEWPRLPQLRVADMVLTVCESIGDSPRQSNRNGGIDKSSGLGCNPVSVAYQYKYEVIWNNAEDGRKSQGVKNTEMVPLVAHLTSRDVQPTWLNDPEDAEGVEEGKDTMRGEKGEGCKG